jgi:hypothetical protein
MFSVRNKGVGLYLPGLNGLLEARFEASPLFHIIRIDTTGLERFDRTAYLLRPEFVQLRVTPFDLTKHKVHLSEKVKVLRKRLG